VIDSRSADLSGLRIDRDAPRRQDEGDLSAGDGLAAQARDLDQRLVVVR